MTDVVAADACVLCGFSAAVYSRRSDAESSLAIISPVVRAAIEDMPEDWVTERLPAAHAVESAASALQESAGEASDEAWSGGLGDRVRATVHEGFHLMAELGRARVAAGRGARQGAGRVAALHASDGGVPKSPIESAEISASGVAGDRQNDRVHHGRPVQAVCLWSLDVIEALCAEGHPIGAGFAGENVTVAGVDWTSLRPGSRIDLGDVPLLISAHAIPCAKNAQWFSDRRFDRILHEKHPGWSRLYAIPLAPGTVHRGDQVTVEPAVLL